MSLNILILDDSELILQMLTMICQGDGHRTHPATNFSDAKNILESQPINLIITDLNLPDIAGQDTVATLRQIPTAENTPIIIISGQPLADLNALAQQCGAQAALSKDDGFPTIAATLPDLIKRFT